MILITNEGLKVLEEKGIKQIVDENYRELDHYMLYGFPFEDDVIEYAQEHQISGLVEKYQEDSLNRRENFIIYSHLIPTLLKHWIPMQNLDDYTKDVVGAYFLFREKFTNRLGHKGSYFWRDEKFFNFIEGDTHRDMMVEQYDVSDNDPQLKLFDEKPLIKKLKHREYSILNGYYTEWDKTLINWIGFCCQIGKQVPFKETWNDEFYQGKFEEQEPGSVIKGTISDLKEGMVSLIPFIEDPMKLVGKHESFYAAMPVTSSGNFESQPFITGDSLVYFSKGEKGIKYFDGIWEHQTVKFSYDQIRHAIKGLVSCMNNYGARTLPHDAGLVFKHFPYEKFEEISPFLGK